MENDDKTIIINGEVKNSSSYIKLDEATATTKSATSTSTENTAKADEEQQRIYEELRAQYFTKKGKKIKAESTRQQTNENALSVGDGAQLVEVEDESYEALRAKYLSKNPFKRASTVGIKASFYLISSSIVFAVILLISLFFFVTPVSQIGKDVITGETLSVIQIFFTAEDSVLNSIKSIFSGSLSSDSVFNIIKLMVVAIALIYWFASSIRGVVKVLGGFMANDAKKTERATYKYLTSFILIYGLIYIFSGTSGGSGDDYYFTGYKISTILSVSLLCAVVYSIVVAVIKYKNSLNSEKKYSAEFTQILVSVVGYLALAVTFVTIKCSGLVGFVFTSGLTSVIGEGGLESINFTSLIFTTLNLLLFSCVMAIWKIISKRLFIGLDYLSGFGRVREQFDTPQPFVAIIVYVVAALVATIVLSIPSIGMGWNINIYTQLCIILITSLTLTAAMHFLPKKEEASEEIIKTET